MVVQFSVKTLFLEMMKICNKKHKKIFIDMVQKMVLKNTEIAIRCGMIMHHAVMNCIANNIIQISVFTTLNFVNQALSGAKEPKTKLLFDTQEAFDPTFIPVNEDLTGCLWLLGHLAKNIEELSLRLSSRTPVMLTESII